MTNSAPPNYHLPELFISDMVVGQQPPRKEPDPAEVANIDMLLAEELLSDLLSDLLPSKPAGRVWN
ncbi:MAG: hypothetical protein SGJ27_28045 [Candidatus Melainabacteria bacterium]|nr:hypothetical protein [Candidatus Melainabacteria bacterium]